MNELGNDLRANHDPLVILSRHRAFLLVSAVLLALLYLEEALGLGALWPVRSMGERLALAAGVALVVLFGTLLAFFWPLRTADPQKYPRAWGVMVTAMIQSVAVTLVTNVVAFALLLWLVGFDLMGAATVLKDTYFFTLLTIVLFHGLILYVRYMHYLYGEFGGADSAAKPITATGGLGAIILIVGLYFFSQDIQWANSATGPNAPIINLHVYVRDLYLWSLTFLAYFWHLRWIADH